MEWKKIFRSGAKRIFAPEKNTPPVPKKNVAQVLRADWLKIGKDFRKVLNSYGGT